MGRDFKKFLRLDKFDVSIVPIFKNNCSNFLEIKVKVKTYLYNIEDYEDGAVEYTEIIPLDDFESKFDVIFDYAKNFIKNEIKKLKSIDKNRKV